MKKTSFAISAALLLLGAGLVAATQAQTPVQTLPKLTLRQLNSLTVSPTPARLGTRLTATLTLTRVTDGSLPVSFSLSEARLSEGNILRAESAWMPATTTVPAGSDRVNVTIETRTSPRSWSVSKTFTLGAHVGSEHISTTFTLRAS